MEEEDGSDSAVDTRRGRRIAVHGCQGANDKDEDGKHGSADDGGGLAAPDVDAPGADDAADETPRVENDVDLELRGGVGDAGVGKHSSEVIAGYHVAGNGTEDGSATGQCDALPCDGGLEQLGKGEDFANVLLVADCVNDFLVGGEDDGGGSVAVGVGLGNDIHGC